ncbi:MAG: flagellar motor protein MotB [Pseudomonadota bacterium]
MDQARPIIIKKKKTAGGDGHHGGAWKVAYADFVTAMMAFFLLMWLLNATSEDQRKGLADFFDPSIPISRNSAGGAGMLNGDSHNAPPEASSTATQGVRPKHTKRERGEDLGDEDKSPDRPDGDAETSGHPKEKSDGTPTDEERKQLETVVDDLLEQAEALGREGLIQHFSMRVTPEGLVIEIGDLQGEPLFKSGRAEPEPILSDLLAILVPVIARTTNDVAVVGHTDAKPFAGSKQYSNWDLSADRANTARRMLIGSGFAETRIVRVSGKAATSPLVEDPLAPRNRRIAVTLLREGRS